jgi:drug/metabolite transporter (DMT)-like permease
MKIQIEILAKFGYAFALFLHLLQTTIIKKVPNFSQLDVYDIMFFRNVFSTLCLFLILIPKFKQIPYKQITKNDILLIFLTSFCYIIATYCWHIGVSKVLINNAVIISFFVPVIVTFMSKVFLKERLNYVLLLSLLICFGAAIFLYKPVITQFNNGYIILLIDVFAYSITTIFRKPIATKLGTIFIIFLANLMMLPISISLSSKPFIIFHSSNTLILPLLAVGLIYCIEILISTKCTTLIAISKLQPVKFLRIVFSILLSYLLLYETPTNNQIIAFVLIVLANSIVFLRR